MPTVVNDVETELTSVRGRRKFPFVQVPHWVLFSGISSGAIHCYALTYKHAEWHSLESKASQKTLAKEMDCSVRSVASYQDELRGIRAIATLKRRWNNSSIQLVALDVPLEDADLNPIEENDSHATDCTTSDEAGCMTSRAKNDYLSRPRSSDPVLQTPVNTSIQKSEEGLFSDEQVVKAPTPDEWFDRAWKEMPKGKSHVQAARVQFKKRLKEGVSAELLVSCTKNYKQHVLRNRQKLDQNFKPIPGEYYVMGGGRFYGGDYVEHINPPEESQRGSSTTTETVEQKALRIGLKQQQDQHTDGDKR